MKYRIECLANEVTLHFRSTDWLSFESDLQDIQRSNSANEYKITIDGKPVTLDQAFDEIANARFEFENKRAETKKQVWVRTGGVTNAKSNFRKIWVNK